MTEQEEKRLACELSALSVFRGILKYNTIKNTSLHSIVKTYFYVFGKIKKTDFKMFIQIKIRFFSI